MMRALEPEGFFSFFDFHRGVDELLAAQVSRISCSTSVSTHFLVLFPFLPFLSSNECPSMYDLDHNRVPTRIGESL